MRAGVPHWLRALQHLKQYSPDNFDYVAPSDLTQDGVAAALDITRPHACQVLQKLVSEGFVEKRLSTSPEEEGAGMPM